VVHFILGFTIGLWHRLQLANIGLISAGVAFYAMLALFPGLTATIAIWSAFADPAVISAYLAVADDFIPPEAFEILQTQILALLNTPHGAFGLGTAVSIVMALFSARAGVGALILGLNVIHGTQPRTTLRSLLTGLAMTLALVGVMLVALATVVVAPLALNLLPFHTISGWLASGLPWGGMLLLLLSALGILYRYGPNTPHARDPILSLGSVMATLVWGAASLSLTYYLANFGSYNRVYGSIGAVIALLMWLYVSAFSVLLGAAFNAEWAERRNPAQ
jgi:membrane protein